MLKFFIKEVLEYLSLKPNEMGKKTKALESYKKGDRVFVKMKGSPYWPARIEPTIKELTSKNRYNVLFYGTLETYCAKIDQISAYNEETKNKYGQPKRTKGFNEGLWQIENSPDLTRKYVGESTEEMVKEPKEDDDAEEEEEEEEDEEEDEVVTSASSTGSKSSAASSPVLDNEDANTKASARRSARQSSRGQKSEELEKNTVTPMASKTAIKTKSKASTATPKTKLPKSAADLKDDSSNDGSRRMTRRSSQASSTYNQAATPESVCNNSVEDSDQNRSPKTNEESPTNKSDTSDGSAPNKRSSRRLSSTKALSSLQVAQEEPKKEPIAEDIETGDNVVNTEAKEGTKEPVDDEAPEVKMETEDIKDNLVTTDLNTDVYDADLEKPIVEAAQKPQSPMKKKIDLHKKHKSDLSDVVKSPKSNKPLGFSGTLEKSNSDIKPKEKANIFTEFSKKTMEEKKAIWLNMTEEEKGVEIEAMKARKTLEKKKAYVKNLQIIRILKRMDKNVRLSLSKQHTDIKQFCMIIDDLIKLPCTQSQLFKTDIVETVKICKKYPNDQSKKKVSECFKKFCHMFPELSSDSFGSAYEIEKKKYLAENVEDLKNEAAIEKYLDKLESRKIRKESETDVKRLRTIKSDAGEPIKTMTPENSIEMKAE